MFAVVGHGFLGKRTCGNALTARALIGTRRMRRKLPTVRINVHPLTNEERERAERTEAWLRAAFEQMPPRRHGYTVEQVDCPSCGGSYAGCLLCGGASSIDKEIADLFRWGDCGVCSVLQFDCGNHAR